jgi:hypothetical protein
MHLCLTQKLGEEVKPGEAIFNPFVYPETAILAYRIGSPITSPHLTSPPKNDQVFL